MLTGPTSSIKAADDLWMARYIIQRVAEEFGLSASFDPNLVKNGIPSGEFCRRELAQVTNKFFDRSTYKYVYQVH